MVHETIVYMPATSHQEYLLYLYCIREYIYFYCIRAAYSYYVRKKCETNGNIIIMIVIIIFFIYPSFLRCEFFFSSSLDNAVVCSRSNASNGLNIRHGVRGTTEMNMNRRKHACHDRRTAKVNAFLQFQRNEEKSK